MVGLFQINIDLFCKILWHSSDKKKLALLVIGLDGKVNLCALHEFLLASIDSRGLCLVG